MFSRLRRPLFTLLCLLALPACLKAGATLWSLHGRTRRFTTLKRWEGTGLVYGERQGYASRICRTLVLYLSDVMGKRIPSVIRWGIKSKRDPLFSESL